MSDDAVYGHDDDCCCCGSETAVDEPVSYEPIVYSDESYDDPGFDTSELPPVAGDGAADLVEPDLPAYAEPLSPASVEAAFVAAFAAAEPEPVFISLDDPAPADGGAPTAPEYVSLADPPVAAAASDGAIPAGSLPYRDPFSDSEVSSMTPQDMITAVLGPAAARTNAPQDQIPISGLPALGDVTDQMADLNATLFAPSGLTVNREDGSRVYEDSSGYKSSSLNDFTEDSSGQNHH